MRPLIPYVMVGEKNEMIIMWLCVFLVHFVACHLLLYCHMLFWENYTGAFYDTNWNFITIHSVTNNVGTVIFHPRASTPEKSRRQEFNITRGTILIQTTIKTERRDYVNYFLKICMKLLKSTRYFLALIFPSRGEGMAVLWGERFEQKT